MIKDYIEQAIHLIEAEREQKVEEIKNSIMQDKIMPHNYAIDVSRDNALQELAVKHDKEIADINAKYEQERQAIIVASEKNKADNANTILAKETQNILVEYNSVISELRKQIEIKE